MSDINSSMDTAMSETARRITLHKEALEILQERYNILCVPPESRSRHAKEAIAQTTIRYLLVMRKLWRTAFKKSFVNP